MSETFLKRGGAGDVVVILMAAGRGLRAGGGVPKQYRPIDGRCCVERCLRFFAAQPETRAILTAIHPDDRVLFDLAAERARGGLGAEGAKLAAPVSGGATRQESALLALEAAAARFEAGVLVAIHDAARPFLAREAFARALADARAQGAACLALPLADTLRRGEGEDPPLCGALVPREGLWRAQTPQVFALGAILAAHRQEAARPATDDAELARRVGIEVALSLGGAENVKITTPQDFVFAERWARAEAETEKAPPRAPDVRVGQAFDVHRFGPNADGSEDHVMLCGVAVAHETGLIGHSDADVALHALADAVLGAAALGDIGIHFPPGDPEWRGADSAHFLREAVRLAAEAGGKLTHLDLTLICERPKIGPHAAPMRARVAEIAGIAVERVSVKATTTEGLGFAGRREGIAAMASATLAFGD